MPRHQNPKPEDDFDRKLRKVRLKIDSLPPEHRPHLYELADTIASQHRRLQQKATQR